MKKYFCSWSGGKDSCLSCYLAMKNGIEVKFLLNFAVDGKAHGIDKGLIKAQAIAMNIPLIQKDTTWNEYEKNFKEEVLNLKNKGIEGMIAGDIDVESHLEWVKNKCNELNIDYIEPLWKWERLRVLNEFVNNGFVAIVIRTTEKAKNLLGRKIEKETINEFVQDAKDMNIDICGENGEYHTLVIDGPIFKKRIEIIKNDEYKHEMKILESEKFREKQWILNIKKWELKEKN